MEKEIRLIRKDDIAALKAVLNSIELFPSELLDELTADYFTNTASEDIWFTSIENDTPISIGYCAPERLTDGTYNLYAIGVRKDNQGQGVGGQMMRYIEERLRKDNRRILIVETSGTPEFELTRKFYEDLGYAKEAVIREFFEEGDDKVVYWKKLR